MYHCHHCKQQTKDLFRQSHLADQKQKPYSCHLKTMLDDLFVKSHPLLYSQEITVEEHRNCDPQQEHNKYHTQDLNHPDQHIL